MFVIYAGVVPVFRGPQGDDDKLMKKSAEHPWPLGGHGPGFIVIAVLSHLEPIHLSDIGNRAVYLVDLAVDLAQVAQRSVYTVHNCREVP